MMTVPELAADALGSFLAKYMQRRYGSTESRLVDLVPSIARIALECIGNSDALYRNVEHTMLVTLAGHDILRGRALHAHMPPEDYGHLIIACVTHDIGYVRGIFVQDDADGFVIDAAGHKIKLPRGASDAALLPHHVDRSKLYIMERIQGIEQLDAVRIARAVEGSRFPSSMPAAVERIGEEAALLRAADLIGQLGDPHYIRKANALYHEFEEAGLNRQLGYESPADIVHKYPQFYWNSVAPYIQSAIRYLNVTANGRQWVANLYSNVFRAERDFVLGGGHNSDPGRLSPSARLAGTGDNSRCVTARSDRIAQAGGRSHLCDRQPICCNTQRGIPCTRVEDVPRIKRFEQASMPAIIAFWTWLGIIACVAQSALFAGLNLAIFSLSQLRLQLEADGGNADAACVLDLRKNSNSVLATVVWGNVSTNVLLTLMSDSVLAGLSAFFFSAIVITLLGEIIPQAYFSRNALRITARFLPFLNFYRVVLFPIAKPTAMLLDWWLGTEGISYPREREVRSLVVRSAASGGDIGRLEAVGARNFFDLDDVPVSEEGEPVHAQSIISLPLENRRCVLPKFDHSPEDPFLRRVDASGMKWVIVTDPSGEPVFVLDSHHFLRDALFNQLESDPTTYWHRPIVVRDLQTKLGEVIGNMRVAPERPGDDVIDNDLILVWGAQKRIITGADLLGRLLRDIATVDGGQSTPAANESLK